jgi:hypothetical protein
LASEHSATNQRGEGGLKVRVGILALVIAVRITPALAQADCGQVPPDVANYMKMQDTWTLLTEADLIPDQQMLWDQDHANECPGMAMAHLSNGAISYAIAMLQHPAEGIIYEQLVLINVGGAAKILAGPEQMDFPSVLFRAGPGRAFDFKTKKYVPIPYDSFVYEHWNSITKTFFLAGGKVQMVQSSY